MKILLINPPQTNFLNYQTGWTFGLKDVGFYQPLGILYVATYLKKNISSVQIKVIDAASPDIPYRELHNLILDFYPDVAGISTYTHTFIDTLKVVDIIKTINPDAHVCLGGHHLTHFARQTLSHQKIDSIIIGEGELKFFNLVNCLLNNKEINNIDGLFTRKNINKVDSHTKNQNHFLDNINILPFPDRNFVKSNHYHNALTKDNKMTTIISSRGCPYTCTFCPQGREPYRPRISADVADEIEACLSQGFSDFFFAEDTFNINNKKVLDFCREVSKRNLKFSWCCKARIHGINLSTLQAMADTGCYLINFGVETGTDEGLKQLHKGTTTSEIRQVFKWCRQAGIKTMAYFMIGHPFETSKEEIEKNISFLISLDPDFCNINTVNPVPYTPLFDLGVKKGILSYEPWKKMIVSGQKFSPKNWEEFLTKEDLQKLRMKSTLKFYFRPSYILKQLRELGNYKQFLYKLKVAQNMILSGVLETVKR